ncbi:DUF459 domain-containing protein [Roseibium sp. RKSG952]|uniref:SGNH/GDSL hydrolase family protein n=1 Tax=Roseibium sp. RKSG952 TaxID=2529384 RepID=UPI0012BCFB95|nr:DUF459 domain-containing protein [Roseibium sp. RKSG952]MTI00107.1 DUF459 domain-containing protein [Roseibium sp. RKSG952]
MTAAVVLVAPALIASPAEAQGVGERLQRINPFRPIIKMLTREPRRVERRIPAQQRPARSSAPRAERRVSTAPPVFVEVPKDENAGVILVVGDRMARGLEAGLRYDFSDQPNVRTDPLTEDEQGFAGAEPADWIAKTLARIRGADVKAVVVMIGRADLDKPFPGDPEIGYASAGWFSEYERKLENLVRAIRRERLPVVLVGMPPTGADRVNLVFEKLNVLSELQTSDSRVRYIDIWDVFLDDESGYSSFGPDVDGKRTRLRTKNQIDFSWAGYRKVAFFVERELSRLLGGYGGLAFEGIEDDPDFIVLTGRTSSPEVELLGADLQTPDADRETLGYKFLIEGQPLPQVPGRVDNAIRLPGEPLPSGL